MKTRYLYNPFFLYIIVYSIALITYSLGWSDLFEPIEFELILFFFSTFIIAFVLGVVFDKTLNYANFSSINYKKKDFVFYFLILSIAIEFFYSGYIPLIKYMQGSISYQIDEFGIPTFHVLIVTLTFFYSVCLIYQFLLFKKSIILLKFIILFSFPILLLYRSIILMTVVAIMLLILFLVKKIRLKLIGKIFLFSIAILYIFGVLGNIRETSSNAPLMKIIQPSKSFIELDIPNEFMWGYVYIGSPVAILQYNMNKPTNYELDNFIITSMIPDVISKRFENYRNIPKMDLIVSWLNVGTQYASAAKYFGLFGMYIIFFLMSIFIFMYSILLKKNKYFLIGLIVLDLMVVFGVFSNMWVFSVVSLQFIYPFMLSIIDKLKLGKLNG